MSRDERASLHCLAQLRRTPALTLRWLVASTTGFFAFAYAFGTVIAARRGQPLEPIVLGTPSTSGQVPALVALVLALVGVVAVHEWIHGCFLARYGGRPRYGVGVSSFGLPYAYAAVETLDDAAADEQPNCAAGSARDSNRTGTDWGYARNELLVVLLAPFVLVTAFGLTALAVVPSPLLAFLLAANAAGSVADLWMAGVLLGYPPAVRVGPSAEGDGGFGIYGVRDRTDRREAAVRVVSAIATGALATYAALVTALGTAVLYALAFGNGTVAVDVLGRTLVRHEFAPERGVALLGVDAPLFVGLSIGGGLAWFALTASARRRIGSGP